MNHLQDGKIRTIWPTPQFSKDQIPPQTNKISVVTGANSGIGFTTSLNLAKNGATVYMLARNAAAGKEAAQEVNAQAKQGGKAVFVQLDLADHKSIEKCAHTLHTLTPRIDTLILNAGVMMTPYMQTNDGLEMQTGVNFVGHMYLEHLLQDLVKGDDPRIVVLSSNGHNIPTFYGNVDPKYILANRETQEEYSPANQYGRSKLGKVDLWFRVSLLIVSMLVIVACLNTSEFLNTIT